jgi:hypothetical protein
MIPFNKLVRLYEEKRDNGVVKEERFFEADRVFLPSEYDRLNPATSAKAVGDYMNYLAEYGQKVHALSPEEARKIEELFARQLLIGGLKNEPVLPPTLMTYVGLNRAANYNDEQILLQNLLGLHKNVLNPLVVGNTVLYNRCDGHQNPLDMLVQNWAIPNQGQAEGMRGNKEAQKHKT